MNTYAYTLVTPPTELAITDAEMEAHARAAGQPSDQYAIYIAAAQAHAEKITARKFVLQTWKWFLDGWSCSNRLILPFGHLNSVTHVKYTDTDAVQTTFASSNYSVSTARDPGVLALKYSQSWPTATLHTIDSIEIQFVCGWATAGEVPADIRAAILLFASHLYKNRDAVNVGDTAAVESKALELGFAALLVNWRLYI